MRIGSHWKHVKRGTVYEIVGLAKMQIRPMTIHPFGYDGAMQVSERLEKRTFVVYRAMADGTLWVRPQSEFIDGRFVELK